MVGVFGIRASDETSSALFGDYDHKRPKDIQEAWSSDTSGISVNMFVHR